MVYITTMILDSSSQQLWYVVVSYAITIGVAPVIINSLSGFSTK